MSFPDKARDVLGGKCSAWFDKFQFFITAFDKALAM
jgi:hypothetical protein